MQNYFPKIRKLNTVKILFHEQGSSIMRCDDQAIIITLAHYRINTLFR